MIQFKIISKTLITCILGLGIQTTAFAEEPGNRVFFRGGSANITEDRAGGVFTDTVSAVTGSLANNDDSGWYFGAGFDFLLSKDTLGLLPGTWAIAELGLEFRHLGSEETLLAGPTLACLAANSTTLAATPGCAISGTQDLTMLVITASPKLKFNEGGKLRPWIIPAGVSFMVISPPSDSANYLDIGVMSGAGIDYSLIPGITLGIDARYHWAANLTDPNLSIAGFDDDQSNDAWTVGVTLGIGF